MSMTSEMGRWGGDYLVRELLFLKPPRKPAIIGIIDALLSATARRSGWSRMRRKRLGSFKSRRGVATGLALVLCT